MHDADQTTLRMAHTLADALYVLTQTPSLLRSLELRDPHALQRAQTALHDYEALLGQEPPTPSSLLQENHPDGTWTCRLGIRHGHPAEESCPHMRAGDYDFCRACSPYQCHHEHDHP